MLALDGFPFSQGRSKFADHHLKHLEPTAKVYVKIRFANLSYAVLAQCLPTKVKSFGLKAPSSSAPIGPRN